MTHGTRIRIAAFLVLSAVGIVYITAAYLGFVDRVLGRGITVHATLPTSGGLYEGSEVTYRGVGIGKVSKMTATRDGVTLDLALEEGTELPLDSPMYVHNLSAVGEQYLDFEPPDDEGPYVTEGTTLKGNEDSMRGRTPRPGTPSRGAPTPCRWTRVTCWSS
jgi:phospholipid/cholesterol/gamma-HCH transport system substrate-binding protein